MRKSEQSLRDPWKTTGHINKTIMGVPEGEERKA